MSPALADASRRRFGSRGPTLPPFGFGTNAIGRIDEETALAMLDTARARGVRYFDTAPVYGAGAAERRLAIALAGLPRDEIVLASKTGFLVASEGEPPVLDYARDATLRSIETSLARLRTDRLDLAFVHDIDPWTHGPALPTLLRTVLDEALPTLLRLREAGVVDAVGIAVNGTRVCREVMTRLPIDGVQIAGRATLLDQAAIVDLAPLARGNGMGLIAAAPFASGLLADETGSKPFFHRPAPDAIALRHRALAAIARRHSVSLLAASLAFAHRAPAFAAVVAGASTPDQLAAVIAARDERVSEAVFADIAAEGLLVGADPAVRTLVGGSPHAPGGGVSRFLTVAGRRSR